MRSAQPRRSVCRRCVERVNPDAEIRKEALPWTSWVKDTRHQAQTRPISGRRGSNSRPLPWQGSALPLSYSRGPGDLAEDTFVRLGRVDQLYRFLEGALGEG